jgi:hypothetical protein
MLRRNKIVAAISSGEKWDSIASKLSGLDRLDWCFD